MRRAEVSNSDCDSPLSLDNWESLLQLVLVLSAQSGEAFELSRAVLGFKDQLIAPAHEAARVVPAVDQTQLRLLRIHCFLRYADLILELKEYGMDRVQFFSCELCINTRQFSET